MSTISWRAWRKSRKPFANAASSRCHWDWSYFVSYLRPSIKMFVWWLKKTSISWNEAQLMWLIFKNLNVHNKVSAERKNVQLIKCIKVFASSRRRSTKKSIKNQIYFMFETIPASVVKRVTSEITRKWRYRKMLPNSTLNNRNPNDCSNSI